MTDVEEGLDRTRDHYLSAILLALLVLISQLLRWACDVSSQRPAWVWLDALLAAVSLAFLAALLATRRQPRRRLALVASASLIALCVPVSLCAAARWRFCGRPFEAFKDAHVAMCSLGLLVPRSLWLGVVALVVLFLASLGIHVWLVTSDTPPALLPSTEPGASIVAAIVGATVLWARKRRCDQTGAYLSAEAEAAALRRFSDVFATVREQLSQQLLVLRVGLRELRTQSIEPKLVERASRAVTILEVVRDQLSRLFSASTAAPQPTPPSATATLSPDEREFYARDAHATARTMAWMTLGLSLVLVPLLRSVLPAFVLALWSLLGLVASVALAILHRTRSRPSEAHDVALCFSVTLPWFAIMAFTQPAFAMRPQAFEPLVAVKMGIVLMPLLVPRRWWISLTAMLLLFVEAVALFYVNHFDKLRDRIPANDPWSTLLYFLIGCALVLTREHRRVASLRRLRAEREVATLGRRSALSMTLLDQTGSPLQVLVISVGLLLKERPGDEQIRRMSQALDAFASLRDSIAGVDAPHA
jgi:hypothetical protein